MAGGATTWTVTFARRLSNGRRKHLGSNRKTPDCGASPIMNIDTPVTQATDVLASFGSEYPTRILVIKGDPVTAGSIAGYLDRYGFRVRTTSNLQDGLRGLAARGPDLVILHLGRAEGLETLRAIRSQSDVPVIAITQADALERVLSHQLG